MDTNNTNVAYSYPLVSFVPFVYWYYPVLFSKKRIFTSRRSRERRRKQYALRIAFFVLVTSVLSAAAAWTSWRPEINISEIKIAGNTTLAEEDVRVFLEERISGGYAHIVSRANVFLFQPRVIEEELQKAFRKIKEVDVSRDSLQSVVVQIEERKPFYLWCDEAEVAAEHPCYFLDIDGYAFAPAPHFSGDVYFELYKPFEEGKSPVGAYFFPEAEFKRLISFRNALREIDVEPKQFTISADGDYVFALQKGTKILFNPKQDFDILFHNLVATFDTEQFSRKQKQGFFLEYIDLRFDNKVYYRFE